MITQEEAARFFAWNNPKRDGGTWDQWCASLMYRYNRARVAYGNATQAGNAAQPLNPDHTQAPIGAVHYWGQGDGHVAQEMRGRGRLLFMASRQVTESLGDAIGMISFDDYAARTSIPYLGWAMRYGQNAILDASDNGSMGDPQPPAPKPIRKDRRKMFSFIRNPQGSIVMINGEAGTYRGLTFAEWAGYAANGFGYADVSQADFDGTLAALKQA